MWDVFKSAVREQLAAPAKATWVILAVLVCMIGLLCFESGRWRGWRDGYAQSFERRESMFDAAEGALMEAELAMIACEDLANGIRRFPRLPSKAKLYAGKPKGCSGACGGPLDRDTRGK